MDNEGFDPENIPGRMAALEQVCISLARAYFSMYFSTPESRRDLADSLRITETEADTLIGGFGSKFLNGLEDCLRNFPDKFDSHEP